MSKFIFILNFLLLTLLSNAQPQWKFHVAFEDATGAKDTLWMIYDTSATAGIDTAFGEGRVAMDPTKFNVWRYNNNFDSTKTHALPYSYFPIHELNSIEAFNYQYPILITWDTSLFHTPFLPAGPSIGTAKIYNDYFWGVNNDPLLHAFNMLIDNHAIAPAYSWGAQNHFPMEIYLYHSTIGIEDLNLMSQGYIFPNPTKNKFQISSKISVEKIILRNLHGNCLKIFENINFNSFDISGLAPGIYILEVYDSNSRVSHQKIIKSF